MTTAEFLKTKVDLFKSFPDELVREVVDGSGVQSFETNEAVAHCGDEVTRFNVLLSGNVSASILGEGGQRQRLGKLEPGSTFGDMAIMTGDRMLADFVADSPSQVLRIPVSLFKSKVMTNPQAVQQLSLTMTERLKEILADPEKSAAALRRSEDPYGLGLKGERHERIVVINCGSSSVK